MSQTGHWWLALGLGLLAAVAVTALLQLLYRQVRRVEAGAAAVWQAGQEVAANTATTWLLEETSLRLGLLTDEAGRHARALDGNRRAR